MKKFIIVMAIMVFTISILFAAPKAAAKHVSAKATATVEVPTPVPTPVPTLTIMQKIVKKVKGLFGAK